MDIRKKLTSRSALLKMVTSLGGGHDCFPAEDGGVRQLMKTLGFIIVLLSVLIQEIDLSQNL